MTRVAERVSLGGHDVPEDTVRRRYENGLRNFFRVYAPLAEIWRFYDNRGEDGPRVIAEGTTNETTAVADIDIWQLVQKFR